jgi:hypothetical protein
LEKVRVGTRAIDPLASLARPQIDAGLLDPPRLLDQKPPLRPEHLQAASRLDLETALERRQQAAVEFQRARKGQVDLRRTG